MTARTITCSSCCSAAVVGEAYADTRCPPCRIEETICKLVRPCDHVLDVGAGIAAYHKPLHGKIVSQGRQYGRLVLLDAHAPYLLGVAGNPRIVPSDVVRIVGTAQTVLPMLGDRFFDVALAIDFIEHLETSDAEAVLKLMAGTARYATAVFTPSGFHAQEDDHFQLGGAHWQKHRSGWAASQLEQLGFKVERWEGFHPGVGDEAALWAVHRGRRGAE